jgi:transposase
MSGLAEILEENRLLREREAALAQSLAQRDEALREREEVLREREQTLEQKDAALQTVTAQRDAVQFRVEVLEQELALIKLRRSGAASHRFVEDDAQTTLAMFGDVTAPPRSPVPEQPEADPESKPPSRRFRKEAPKQPRRRSREDFAHLPSRKVTCPASKDEACAKCGERLQVVGKSESFRIGWVPGHYVVEDIVRDKCACPNCPGEGVLTVPAPYALDKALCADSLLARVLVDKFADHLPLNRQAARMAREGFDVATSTLSSWVVQGAGVMHLVAMAVRTELLAAGFLQGDDTGMPVQDGGDGQLRKGRFWAFTDQQQVFYAFTDTKHGKFPAELLEGFRGDCLLVDGGSEFNQAVGGLDLDRAGCWSHLRTYFYDALSFHPHEAGLALGTIRDVFLLERQFATMTAAQRLEARREHTKPLVDGLYRWMRELSVRARPKSKLMEAITYGINQEEKLRVCLDRGDIPIHNNLSELLLRQPVVGRKNWLFARSEGGAVAAADIFTLIGSCRLQGIDPHAYLVDVLGRVQDCKRPQDLTPRAWRLAKDHPG